MYIKYTTIVCALLLSTNGHNNENHWRRSVPQDLSVINCRLFKREAHQHKCVLAKEFIEGPYFIDQDIERSNITEGQIGFPLQLAITVTNANTCQPIQGANVYVWHNNYLGYYSGFEEHDPDKPFSGKFGKISKVTDKKRYLRGNQYTDENGNAVFDTVYPGFYYGRSVHIHVEVYLEGSWVFVGQLFFNDSLSSEVHKQWPYSEHKYPKRTFNSEDEFYMNGGVNSTLNVFGNFNGMKTAVTLGVVPHHSSSQKWSIHSEPPVLVKASQALRVRGSKLGSLLFLVLIFQLSTLQYRTHTF